MDDDWDLHALVRSCTGTTATATSSAVAGGSDRGEFDFCYRYEDLVAVPDPFNEARASFAGDLHELYKPFFPKSSPQATDAILASSVSSLSRNSLCFSRDVQVAAPESSARALATNPVSAKTSHVNRSKRRKNLVKKVKHVDADELSSDVWSWRKYGQKPIKGSPYPRGYYRCSSSKGCLARKQVERNRSDPGKFIVTYTGEHNHPIPTHRNSLAGSSRRKLPTSPTSPPKPTCSSPSTSAEEDLSALKIESGTELEDLMEDDGEFGLSDMTVSDDFFAGLEELAGPVSVDSFSDPFPGNFSHPWAAAAGGGL